MVGQGSCYSCCSRAGTSQPRGSARLFPEPTTARCHFPQCHSLHITAKQHPEGWSQHKPHIPGGRQMPDTRTSPSRPLPDIMPASGPRCIQSGPDLLSYLDMSILQAASHRAAPLLLQVLGFLALLPGNFQAAAAHHHPPEGRQEPCAVLLQP